MLKRDSRAILLVSAMLAPISGLRAQEAQPLKAADLSIAGISVDQDSATVRRHLGTPASIDSAGWHYQDLQVFLVAGKVGILSITGPSRQTHRGLRVGDPLSRAVRLYRPCVADSTIVQICFKTTDFDERAVIAVIVGGHVSRISVGRIIEP